MNLVVEKNGKYTENFIKWLVRLIHQLLIETVDMNRLKSMNDEFKAVYNDSRFSGVTDAFLSVVNDISWIETNYEFIIYIKNSINTSNPTLRSDTIAKFINYGNSSVAGCEVFSNVFYSISKNLNGYYQRYIMMVEVI